MREGDCAEAGKGGAHLTHGTGVVVVLVVVFRAPKLLSGRGVQASYILLYIFTPIQTILL